jgi:hypothetical protein
MRFDQLISQPRQVGGFERVALRCPAGETLLIIAQGEKEALTIEARQSVARRVKTEVYGGCLTITAGGSWSDRLGDMLQTSLTRPQITYRLTVNKLVDLQITGFALVRIGNLDTERLALGFSGAGGVQIGSLTAGLLEVDLRWAGQVEVAGRVAEQRVQVSLGTYSAPRLHSKHATVTLKGAGNATVWAVDALDLVVRGPGGVAYYGSPMVRRSLSPVARVTRLGALPA